MNPNTDKLAIVASGGGMRCAYSVGALLALKAKFALTAPEILVGNSGSSASLCYYLAGQTEELKQIWLDELSTPRFKSWWRPWRVLDIDYLVDQVFRLRVPLDIDRLCAPRYSVAYFAVTCARSGEPLYFTHYHPELFEMLRASKAVPLVYGRRVRVNGDVYVDGSVGSSLWLDELKALAEGATRLIVLDNRDTSADGLFSWYRRRNGFPTPPEAGGDADAVARVALRYQGAHHPLDNRRAKLRETFEAGWRDVMASSALEQLLYAC